MQNRVKELAAKPEHTLPCSPDLVKRHMPWRHIGFDKQGRPVVLKHMGHKCMISDVAKGCKVSDIVDFHIWQCESSCRLLAEQSQRLGVCIEQWVVIVDNK